MSLSLYMDHNVRREITAGLRRRGVDVLTASEDAANRLPDDALLSRATDLGRVMFTHDDDFLTEAASRQDLGIPFAGVIYAHQMNITIGQAIEDLELIVKVYDEAEMQNAVHHLPL